jgi:dethiobiotin synthetase
VATVAYHIDMAMFTYQIRPDVPGLFVTGTDTGVGKTAVTCAIAAAVRRQWRALRVGVCKPIASGCRRDREGLVSEDAEALAHFADCRLPLDVVNPVRYAAPLAPAVAAERVGEDVDFDAVARSLVRIAEASDVLLVEGVGGLLVPLDARGRFTVLDLAVAVDYPVLIVARSTLGTLNHTAMTARLLRDAGCRIAGVVMNNHPVDGGRLLDDPSVMTNRVWIERMTGVRVLATIPQCPPDTVRPERGVLNDDVIEAATLCYWPDVLARCGSGAASR